MLRLPFVIALIGCSSFVFAQTTKDTIVVSDRVGRVIDQCEREYFRLFPDVENFQSASLISDTNFPGQINIHIKTSNQEDTQTLEFKDAHVSRLASYIDRYENTQLARSYYTFKKDYWSLYRKDIISYMIFEDLTEITLHVSNNQQLSQITMGLLYADSNVVIMSEIFDSLDLDAVHIFSIDDITSITYTDGGAFWRGLAWGTFITGGTLTVLIFATGNHDNPIDGKEFPTVAYAIGSAIVSVVAGSVVGLINHIDSYTNEEDIEDKQHYFKAVLPELQERQFFKHGLPPELRTKINAQ